GSGRSVTCKGVVSRPAWDPQTRHETAPFGLTPPPISTLLLTAKRLTDVLSNRASVNSKGAVSCRVWGGKRFSRNCGANWLTQKSARDSCGANGSEFEEYVLEFLANARYQLDRVAGAWATKLKADNAQGPRPDRVDARRSGACS